MGFNRVEWLGGIVVSGIPHHQLVIIADGTKHRIMEYVPGHIFHHRRVSSEGCGGVQIAGIVRSSSNVPQTDSLVVRGREELARHTVIPGQTIT